MFSPTRKTGTESQQTTRSYAAGHFTEKFCRIRCHRKFRRIRCHRIFRRIRCHRKFRRIRCHRIFCRKLQPRRRRGAPPKGEKSGDGDPAPPRGERREDGNRYTPAAPWEETAAAVPNVDPGGQQRPEVIGTLCGRGGFEDPSRSRVRDPDRRRHFLIHTSQWTFPTCLRGPKEELPIKPRPLQEVHQRKTLVMGPAFPNENRNPNKWETQKK